MANLLYMWGGQKGWAVSSCDRLFNMEGGLAGATLQTEGLLCTAPSSSTGRAVRAHCAPQRLVTLCPVGGPGHKGQGTLRFPSYKAEDHWAWWHTSAYSTLRRPRPDDPCEFGACLNYLVRLCLEKKKQVPKEISLALMHPPKLSQGSLERIWGGLGRCD